MEKRSLPVADYAPRIRSRRGGKRSGQSVGGAAGPDERPPFQVMLVCEDAAAGRHAMKLLDSFDRRFGDEFSVSHKLWKLDEIRREGFRKRATREARLADMVVFSVRPARQPSRLLSEWIGEWIDGKCGCPSLMVLLTESDAGRDDTHGLEAGLKAWAEKGGMDFLAGRACAEKTLVSHV